MMELRESLPPLPPKMKRLALDRRGFPVPWFIQWFDVDKNPTEYGVGEPDFRVMDDRKLVCAVKDGRCWVCGDKLGHYKCFVIGPMCAINRVISEPPSHRECAVFSAKACPFLSQPRMKRNEKGLPEERNEAPGFGLRRNPGAMCIWICHTFRPFRAFAGAPGVLFRLGDPVECLWFANGREATRDEVLASIDSGYPSLMELAEQEGADAVAALTRQRAEVIPLLPPA